MKQLTLHYPGDYRGNNYRVVEVVNSTRYVPGEILLRDEVTELSENPNWKVVVRGDK